MDYIIEELGGNISCCRSVSHNFGTDAFLLSGFARPKQNDAACDLCTGCGIIPLLWMRGEKIPKNVVAVDIQRDAIALLERSVKLSGLAERLVPLQADLRDLKGKLPFGAFDLVTCNPPYKAVGTGILSSSKSERIARHETMCTMEDCCAAAEKLLKYGGRFCVCQLPERLVDVFALMRAHKIEPKRMRFVQKDAFSAPWLVLVEGRRGAKPFLKAEPPLFLFENGATSPEMRDIYGLYGNIIEP